MRGICIGKTGLVETFLYNLRVKVDEWVFQFWDYYIVNQFACLFNQINYNHAHAIVIYMEWKQTQAIQNTGFYFN